VAFRDGDVRARVEEVHVAEDDPAKGPSPKDRTRSGPGTGGKP
jgi:hypothetical protein